MIYKIPFRFAVNLTLLILGLIIVFHVLVLTQILPYTLVWGGKFDSTAEMMGYESLSIVINSLMILVLIIKAQYVKIKLPAKIIDNLIWFFVFLFGLNSVGNLFAETTTEAFVFTPLTVLLTLMCYRIAKENSFQKVSTAD